MGQIISKSNYKKTYLDDKTMKPHRLDGPAVVWNDGSEEWWVNGKRHRLDGPAVILLSGVRNNLDRYCINTYNTLEKGTSKEWWVDGKLHREDGPAIECIAHERSAIKLKINNFPLIENEYPKDTQEWYLNGKRHRLDGPAITSSSGIKVWIQNGKIGRNDDSYSAFLPRNAEYIWFKNGKIHRENLPAVIHPTGNIWYHKGKVHREDGPAHIVIDNVYKKVVWYENNSRTLQMEYFGIGNIDSSYWKDSKFYREDGPAIVRRKGIVWFQEPGIQCRKEGPCEYNFDYNNKLRLTYCYDSNSSRSSGFESFFNSLSDEEKLSIIFNIEEPIDSFNRIYRDELALVITECNKHYLVPVPENTW